VVVVASHSGKKKKGKAMKKKATADPLSKLRPGDKKLMKSFLRKVEESLWSISNEDKEKALDDLKGHVIEKSKRWNVDNATEIAIFSMGSPEVIAKGIRTLYGYGSGFKSVLVSLVIFLSIPSVLMFNPLFNVLSILSLLILFYLLSHFGTKTGLAFGGGMGFMAAVTRVATIMVITFAFPSTFTLGTQQAIIDFSLVSVFLILVGLLAGHIRDTTVRKFFSHQAI
jgi:hypothetical protein